MQIAARQYKISFVRAFQLSFNRSVRSEEEGWKLENLFSRYTRLTSTAFNAQVPNPVHDGEPEYEGPHEHAALVLSERCEWLRQVLALGQPATCSGTACPVCNAANLCSAEMFRRFHHNTRPLHNTQMLSRSSRVQRIFSPIPP